MHAMDRSVSGEKKYALFRIGLVECQVVSPEGGDPVRRQGVVLRIAG